MKYKKEVGHFIFEILIIILGTLIMGFSFSVFLEPNSISTGGFSALAMIISVLFENWGVNSIPTSAIYLILNIGLFGFALKTIGKKFSIKAFVGIVSFSLGIQLFNIIDLGITYELFISAVFGGLLMGVGIGLVVRFGGSTGGSDMIASIIKNKKPNASLGSFILIVDLSIIGLSLFVFTNGLELLPYTIVALVLCMYLVDFVNEGYKEIRAFNIITTKPEEISNAIMENLSRGCSCTTAKGMHSKNDKSIVLCLISKFQINQLRSIIKQIDPNAFVYSVKVSAVEGNWHSVETVTKNHNNKKSESLKNSKKD